MSQLVRTVSLKRQRTGSYSAPPSRGRAGRSYARKAYPKLTLAKELSMLNNYLHPIVMSGSFFTSINASTGFAASSPSLCFAFQMSGVVYSLGGGAYINACVFDNQAGFQSVFDQYKLTKVICQVIFTSNSSATNSSVQLPTMYGICDADDANLVTSEANALSYSNCKVMQLGNSSGPTGGIQTLTLPDPMAQISALSTNLGLSSSAMQKRSPWLDTAAGNIEHTGMKFYVNTPGGTNAVSGYCQFVFRSFFTFKNLS